MSYGTTVRLQYLCLIPSMSTLLNFQQSWKFWLTTALILFVVFIQIRGWIKWTRLIASEDADRNASRLIWGRVRLSDFLVFFSVVVFVYSCSRFPPDGTRPLLAICRWLAAGGCLIRLWEED